jgi:hypothetical protein
MTFSDIQGKKLLSKRNNKSKLNTKCNCKFICLCNLTNKNHLIEGFNTNENSINDVSASEAIAAYSKANTELIDSYNDQLTKNINTNIQITEIGDIGYTQVPGLCAKPFAQINYTSGKTATSVEECAKRAYYRNADGFGYSEDIDTDVSPELSKCFFPTTKKLEDIITGLGGCEYRFGKLTLNKIYGFNTDNPTIYSDPNNTGDQDVWKVAYITPSNEYGFYDNKYIQPKDDYELLGNFNSYSGRVGVGGETEHIKTETECKDLCNKTNICGGYTTEKRDGKDVCFLLPSNFTTRARYYTNAHKTYLRKKKVVNGDCDLGEVTQMNLVDFKKKYKTKTGSKDVVEETCNKFKEQNEKKGFVDGLRDKLHKMFWTEPDTDTGGDENFENIQNYNQSNPSLNGLHDDLIKNYKSERNYYMLLLLFSILFIIISYKLSK